MFLAIPILSVHAAAYGNPTLPHALNEREEFFVKHQFASFVFTSCSLLATSEKVHPTRESAQASPGVRWQWRVRRSGLFLSPFATSG